VQVVPIALTFVPNLNIQSTSPSYVATFPLFLLEFGPVLVLHFQYFTLLLCGSLGMINRLVLHCVRR
jgi:hypothetical protein